MEINHHVVEALKARAIMKRDVDYIVKDGEIVIVDEGGADLVSAVLDPPEHKKQKRRQMYEQTGSGNCWKA